MVANQSAIRLNGSGVSQAQTKFECLVRQYYLDVDQASVPSDSALKGPSEAEQALGRVNKIWGDRAGYNRAGRLFQGQREISDFYTSPYPKGRGGLVGTHTVERLLHVPNFSTDCLSIVDEGVFRQQSGAETLFADLWQTKFTGRGSPKISFRETFLHSNELDRRLASCTPSRVTSFQTQSEVTLVVGEVMLLAERYRFISLMSYNGLNLVGLKYWDKGAERLRPSSAY